MQRRYPLFQSEILKPWCLLISTLFRCKVEWADRFLVPISLIVLFGLPANLSFEAGTYGQVLQPCPLPFNEPDEFIPQNLNPSIF